jgi:phospholipid/cholesterol/gamma-HCH transport system ATP-binding protein
LLCDEPTSGLDPINSAQMDNLILFLKEQNPGMTIVVVSHDIQSLLALAEHVLVFHGGGIVFNGPMEKLKNSEDAFLRKFVNRDAAMADKENQRHFSLSAQKRKILQEALDEWLEKK